MALPPADLKEMRRRRGLTLRDAATEIGVATSVLHRTERGMGVVSLPNAVKIASYYGLAVTDLIPVDEAA
jgi:transcriptional regulator with XRE-family HTH domain